MSGTEALIILPAAIVALASLGAMWLLRSAKAD